MWLFASVAGTAGTSRQELFPRPDVDRDGANEPGGWPGYADPSGLRAEPQCASSLRDMGATWVPTFRRRRITWKRLKPLLDLFGNEPGLTIILFTLDETTFSRELAPLAGHYPCLRLGSALVVLR